MLNTRLYRLSWLVAGVALVVALLTLQSPRGGPEPDLPPAFDAAAARQLAGTLAAVAPERTPGSAGDRAAADLVARELKAVPGVREVARQEFAVRSPAGRASTSNVYIALPSRTRTGVRRGILLVAPRDTPPGVRGGTTGTAVLIELARILATASHDRPIYVLSTGASTLGNSGIRYWFARNSRVPLFAAVVLDDPAAGEGTSLHVWDDGTSGTQSLAMRALAAQAVRRAGGQAEAVEGTWPQVADLAVSQSVGDQGPLNGSGVPAVTLAARSEAPLTTTGPELSLDRLALVGNTTESLVGTLDAADQIEAPAPALAIGGKELRPVMSRIALLLLALPVLVAALDTLARLRRARVRVGPAVSALLWRALPALTALGALYLFVLVGLLPIPAGGAPPLAVDVPFDAPSGLALVLALLAALAIWLATREHIRTRVMEVSVLAGAGAVVLSVLILVLWLVRPFALALALPMAHAGLVASVVRRRWQVALLAAIALAPLIALSVSVAGTLDRNPAYAAWYLLETSASGARGWLGPVLAVLVAACAWTLAGLVLFRARKGLVAPGEALTLDDRRARRRRGRRVSMRTTIDDRRSRGATRTRGRRPPPTMR